MTAPPLSPDRRIRLIVALAVGALGALLAFRGLSRTDSDFAHFHMAARLVLEGRNPYDRVGWPLTDYYLYPLPTALVLVPLAWMPSPWAGAIVFGAASALLALGLTRTSEAGPWALLVFTTPAYLIAAKLGQWSPLLAAAAFWPAIGWVVMLKPNLGLALFAGWPRWRTVIVAGAIGVASLLVLPTWPAEWLRNATSIALHPAPIRLLGGPLLLLALVRWRRPEARLVAVRACVPQVFLFADQLLVSALVPRTKLEHGAMTAAVWAAYALTPTPSGSGERLMTLSQPYIIALVYGAALLIVLRRPNEGTAPGWLETAIVRVPLPAWLRGRGRTGDELATG
jgi:hypothetical protein